MLKSLTYFNVPLISKQSLRCCPIHKAQQKGLKWHRQGKWTTPMSSGICP